VRVGFYPSSLAPHHAHCFCYHLIAGMSTFLSTVKAAASQPQNSRPRGQRAKSSAAIVAQPTLGVLTAPPAAPGLLAGKDVEEHAMWLQIGLHESWEQEKRTLSQRWQGPELLQAYDRCALVQGRCSATRLRWFTFKAAAAFAKHTVPSFLAPSMSGAWGCGGQHSSCGLTGVCGGQPPL
jgi:hypothetical protein